MFGITASVTSGSIKISHDLTPQVNTVKKKTSEKAIFCHLPSQKVQHQAIKKAYAPQNGTNQTVISFHKK